MLLNETKAMQEGASLGVHFDLSFTNGGTILHFVWDPYLNSSALSALPEYIAGLDHAIRTPGEIATFSNNSLEARIQARTPPGKGMPRSVLAVVGGGLWFSQNFDEVDTAVNVYKETIDNHTASLAHTTLRKSLTDIDRSHVLFMPAEPPIYSMMAWNHAHMTPDKVEPMNEYIHSVADSRGVDILTSFTTMATQTNNSLAWEMDGVHDAWPLVQQQAQIILNAACNNRVAGDSQYNVTCCRVYSKTWTQTSGLFFSLTIILVALSAEYLGVLTGSKRIVRLLIQLSAWRGEQLESTLQRQLPALRQAATMCAVISYCLVADRSHIFAKLSRPPAIAFDRRLIASMLAVVTLSLGGLRRIEIQDQKVLSRRQTGEWLGLLQIPVFVIYYFGDLSDLATYKIARLSVSCYLFVTTYGYASSMYQNSSFQLRRVLSPILRLNLLATGLCWALNTPYTLYLAPILCTIWFLSTFAIMHIRSDWNKSLRLVFVKLSFAAAIVLTGELVVVRMLTDITPWSPSVTTHWPQPLDLYSSLLGILVAIVVRQSDDSIDKDVESVPRSWTDLPYTRASLTLGAIAGLCTYSYMSISTNLAIFDTFHTYLVLVPILSYVWLRNCTVLFRTWYLASLSWVGPLSLELFVLHRHIWLGANGKALLATGFFGVKNYGVMTMGRWLDCVLLGAILLIVAWKARGATVVLAEAVAAGIMLPVDRRRQVTGYDYQTLGDTEFSFHDSEVEAASKDLSGDLRPLEIIELVDSTKGSGRSSPV